MNEGVREGEWIKVGVNDIDAYVFKIISSTEILAGYYQNRIKAIKEAFVWNGTKWDFKNSSPSGSYLRGSDEALVKKGPANF
ncbi:hypothetical protein KO537_07805 [Shewanella sp. NKUCC01_JLK]|uniref:hypothetical protein n=1 Tax=Shewanella sp. NKUCC01_JLK TaxID=2842123 RepID=UPI001C5BF004|nr:hypothetical protein [Shewanella sp. NKUCC01_JLK]MBW3514623.1 hypothetical protein [Shewanella sp. NKUCC01_JLK]